MGHVGKEFRLVLACRSELTVRSFQFFEESDILNGDHGLVSEGPEESNLVVREWSRLGATHEDHSDRNAVPEHRDKEAAAKANRACQVLNPILWIDLDIGNVDHVAVEDGPADPQAAAGACGEQAVHGVERLGRVVVCGDGIDQVTVEPVEATENSVAQSHSAFDDGVENRLYVGWRA